jgi:hypothetical protein
VCEDLLRGLGVGLGVRGVCCVVGWSDDESFRLSEVVPSRRDVALFVQESN